jgi:hypothetical protein
MGKQRKEERAKPAPEILDDNPWLVIEDSKGGSVTSEPDPLTGDYIMRVPLADTTHAKAVRKHEMAHIAFTPKERATEVLKASKHPDTLQCLEDYRVNTLAQKRGIDFGDGFDPKIIETAIDFHGARGDLKRVLLGTIAAGEIAKSKEVACRTAIKYLTDDKLKEILRNAAYRMKNGLESFETTVDTAAWLDEAVADYEEEKEKERKKAEEGEDESAAKIEDFAPAPGELPTKEEATAFGKSGKMKVEMPPLVRPVNKDKTGKTEKLTDSGVIMRRPSRYLIDKRIFKRSTKGVPGGTILVDVSGSMSLNEDHIFRLIEARPAAVVAVYCGAGREGILRVIVRKGQMVSKSQMHPSLGCNVVDYPALLWLGRQKGPRLWVCDGYVTGIGDRSSLQVTRACTEAQIRGSIKRFQNMEDLMNGVVATGGLN